MPHGLPRKLRRVFILQAMMAAFAVAVVLYGAGTLFGSSLTESRVVAEAADYWAGRATNPDYPLPRTSTVTSYFVPAVIAIAVWTFVLVMVFIKAVYDEALMPEFDATLLGLLGISSGTYLGFKFPEKPA